MLLASSSDSSYNAEMTKIIDKNNKTNIAIESPFLYLFLNESTANTGNISITREQIAPEKVYVEIIKKHNIKSIIMNL
mgnify:CR=1 FL=1